MVVFRDDERKKPYTVIECKQDGVTDAEFNQAVEQACGNGTWAKFRANYVGVVAGMTRRFLDFSEKYGVLEREANIIADLPRQYGKPEEYRFYKGDLNNDIQPVSKEAAAEVASTTCVWVNGDDPAILLSYTRASDDATSAGAAFPGRDSARVISCRKWCRERIETRKDTTIVGRSGQFVYLSCAVGSPKR